MIRDITSIFREYQICPSFETEQRDFADVFKNLPHTTIGKWFFSRVFRLEGQPWVVKEGRWDLDLPLFFGGKKTIQWLPIQTLLSVFSYSFLPTLEEEARQYREYLLLCRYFGYFGDGYEHYDDYAALTAFQYGFRANLSFLFPVLEHRFGIKISEKIFAELPVLHNFLPREYLCYWAAVSEENKEKNTSYIIQEFLSGKPLSDMDMDDFSREQLLQMYLFCLLALLFFVHTGCVLDTRPSKDPKHWAHWLMKTENIFVTHDRGIQLLDTRWLWNTHSNLVRRWVLIPELIIQSTVRTAKSLEKKLRSLEKGEL